MTRQTSRTHLLLIGALAGVVMFINASSSDNPLRAQDRDLFALLSAENPKLLRGLDLLSPAWGSLLVGDLQTLDLSGQDLRSLRLSKRSLKHVNLRGSHLDQATFQCVPMTNVDLSGAELRQSRFHYSDCSPRVNPLKLQLNGADLSSAVLQGGQLKDNKCQSTLVIEGNLNGAKFEGASLQCVRLINTAAVVPRFPSSPQYAGINFVNSDVSHLELNSGDFVFSNFYRAKLRRLSLDPATADLRFSTLADLQCPKELCVFQLEPDSSASSEAAAETRLSLNVRGSRLISNLALAQATNQWPALLCDQDSQWRRSPSDATTPLLELKGGVGFWIQKGGVPTCSGKRPSPSSAVPQTPN